MESVEIRIGSVIAGGGELCLSVVLEKDGRIWVDLFASGYGARAGGVLLRLRPESIEVLEAKLREAGEAVARLRALVR